MDHSNRKSRILATGLIAISMATNTSTNAFSSITALLSARRTISISNHHHSFNIRSIHFRRKSSQLVLNAFHDDYGQDDEDEDLIDVNSLGDWRTFRRHLLVQDEPVSVTQSRASPENLDVLRSQNPELAKEYHTGVWAHETSTVGLAIVYLEFYCACFI